MSRPGWTASQVRFTVDPSNKEELKKYDNRHELSELADTLRKEFGVTTSHLTQLIECTGTLVCRVPSADGKRIDTYQGSGNIALQPNILVAVKHGVADQTGLLGLDENVLHPMLALLPQPKPSP